MILIDLDELLQVVQRLFKDDKRWNFSDKIITQTYKRKFRLFIKLRVVHAKIYYLFIVNNRNKLSTSQERFVMFNRKIIPFFSLKLLY